MSGGKVKDLLEGLRTVGNCSALTVLEGALRETEHAPPAPQSTTKLLGKLKNNSHYTLCDFNRIILDKKSPALNPPYRSLFVLLGVSERVCDLKLDGWEDSGVCDSGVELSTA